MSHYLFPENKSLQTTPFTYSQVLEAEFTQKELGCKGLAQGWSPDQIWTNQIVFLGTGIESQKDLRSKGQ